MNLKNYVISENKAVVRDDPVVLSLLRKEFNKSQYKLYAAQRAYVASNFVRLVEKAAQLARILGDDELAGALQANANDEIGMGADGKIHYDMNHRQWKTTYLRAIDIDADIDGFPLLPATRAHVNAFLEIESEGTVFSMAGAVLSLENIIPLEYRAAVSSRDHLFPEIFCIDAGDTAQVRADKAAARRYLDDHIVHDANSHFPMLLNALLKYEDNAVIMTEIRSGIDLVNSYRKRFYNGLQYALQFDEADMAYYTYGERSDIELAVTH
ncbi:MAG TPA: iron-containing redox enzyme family protein [Burkholderiaceae bacterium]